MTQPFQIEKRNTSNCVSAPGDIGNLLFVNVQYHGSTRVAITALQRRAYLEWGRKFNSILALCQRRAATMSERYALSKETEALLEKYHQAFDECVSLFTGLKTFEPQSDDVVIASFMKSGTTLAQQMLYQIMVATGRVPSDPLGNDFEDISMVVPFIEMPPNFGVYKSIHPYSPRVWHSHYAVDDFAAFPKTTRYLYCVRNGMNVAPSMIDFTLDWILGKPVEGEELRRAFYPRWFLSKFLGIEPNGDGSYTENDYVSGTWFAHVKGLDRGGAQEHSLPDL